MPFLPLAAFFGLLLTTVSCTTGHTRQLTDVQNDLRTERELHKQTRAELKAERELFRETRAEMQVLIGKLEPLLSTLRPVGEHIAMDTSEIPDASAQANTPCEKHETPAGHEGYLHTVSNGFIGIQNGPIWTDCMVGLVVTNVDMRQRTFIENIRVRPRSGGKERRVKASVEIRLRSGGVKDVVEKLGGKNWYASNVRDQFRAVVREHFATAAGATEYKGIADAIQAHLVRNYDRITPIIFGEVTISTP